MTRIGIIGLGFMGRFHYQALAKLPGAEVVAVCDADPRRAAGDLSGGWAGNIGPGGIQQLPMDRIKGYTDWRELVANPDVEVVDVCLPTPLHPEVSIAALGAGKHVLCEKPMARTVAEARAIADAAARARGIFMPAMCMRFWSEWEWLKRAVAEEHYGKARSAAFRRLGTLPGDWFRDGTRSGGAILDLHVHDTDFIYYLFGKPNAVFSRGHRGGSGAVNHVVTQYLYDADPARVVSAEGSWAMADGWGFRMAFTVNFERATADFDMARKERSLLLHAQGNADPVQHPGHNGYAGELAYFLECVKTHQKPERVTADDAVAGLEIIDAEQRSVESGRVEAVA